MISLVQASCANYERCQRGETCGTAPCSPCPAQLRKAHEPAVDGLGAGWAHRVAVQRDALHRALVNDAGSIVGGA